MSEGPVGVSLERSTTPRPTGGAARYRHWPIGHAGKLDDRCARQIQPVDTTHSLSSSAGVWKPSVLREAKAALRLQADTRDAICPRTISE